MGALSNLYCLKLPAVLSVLDWALNVVYVSRFLFIIRELMKQLCS